MPRVKRTDGTGANRILEGLRAQEFQRLVPSLTPVQKAGFIRYSRGQVTVLDREGLEQAACECYGIIRAEFDRLLP